MPVTINGGGVVNYGDAVLDTPGLVDYWRMGEARGPTFADSEGHEPRDRAAAPTFGVARARRGRPEQGRALRRRQRLRQGEREPLRHVGSDGRVLAQVGRSYRNEDALAMELTPNFNGNDGGFLVDPDAAQFGGTFGVGLGRGDSRNNVFFTRPSAGTWHHYALVLDSTKPAGDPDHAVRRRQSRELPEARQRHGRRATSPTRC